MFPGVTDPAGDPEDPCVDSKVGEGLHTVPVFDRAGECDLIHNSAVFPPLAYSRLDDTPVVTTNHGFSSERIVPVYERYDGHVHYVAISDADRHPKLHYAATIHHGIDMGAFELGGGSGGYLLFFGRIHHDKGVVEALDLAERTGLQLLIAGIVQDERYYDE